MTEFQNNKEKVKPGDLIDVCIHIAERWGRVSLDPESLLEQANTNFLYEGDPPLLLCKKCFAIYEQYKQINHIRKYVLNND